MKKKSIKRAYHRNGISGCPFHIVIFKEGKNRFVGIRFSDPGDDGWEHNFQPYTAVFDIDLLNKNIIEFGENSWRGDEYEKFIRDIANCP